MILPQAIAEKATVLANTPDELLPGFSPLERAAIMALKAMLNKTDEKKDSPADQAKQREHHINDVHDFISPATS